MTAALAEYFDRDAERRGGVCRSTALYPLATATEWRLATPGKALTGQYLVPRLGAAQPPVQRNSAQLKLSLRLYRKEPPHSPLAPQMPLRVLLWFPQRPGSAHPDCDWLSLAIAVVTRY